jgi:Domain of unknown function (DUF4276)
MTKKQVVLYIEGKHDETSLPTLILRILKYHGKNDAENEFEFTTKRHKENDNKIQGRGAARVHGKWGASTETKISGYQKKILSMLKEAEENSFDYVVFLIDQDGYADRTRDAREILQDKWVLKKFTHIPDIPSVISVAIEALDAWVLTDEEALSKVTGQIIPKQKEPENFKGNPKNVCQKILEDSKKELSLSNFYKEIFENLNVKNAEKSSKSLEDFSEQIKKVFCAKKM